MQFIAINNSGIYQGTVTGIEGDIPGSWLSPSGIKVSMLGLPPTDEPGKWRDDGTAWVEVTPEQELDALKQQFTAAIDGYMNHFAKTRGYDSMASAASYAGDEDPQFDLEGTYCKAMRSRVYRAAWDILDDVVAGKRSMPSLEEVFAELPELKWPEEAA
ncbi:MAG: hypothetical protein FWG04_05200 [Desulfovibrionaceae bacterium]|nr:hypothetical protein [Desulfovibrionaceae bacterium]